ADFAHPEPATAPDRRSFSFSTAPSGVTHPTEQPEGPAVKPSDAPTTSYRTRGGITVHRSTEPCDPEILTDLVRSVEHRRGGVLSSGMEYPGRYDRWHLGYIDPCLEITTRKRRVTATALNARGRVLLPVVTDALATVAEPHIRKDGRVEVNIPEPDPDTFFTEEERSRRPSVFTALRALIDVFSSPEEENLGLYGAFGYALAFQFEPSQQQPARPSGALRCALPFQFEPPPPPLARGPAARGLVLPLPGAIGVRDRKRQTFVPPPYEFPVPSGKGRPEAGTAGLDRITETTPKET